MFNPRDTIEGLNQLTRLFDHSRENAAKGGVALSEWLDAAIGMMGQLTPAVAAARGGPHHASVLQAALRAKQSHDALAGVIGFEVARLSREISQMGAGAEATAQYGRGAEGRGRAVLDRVG